MAVSSSPSKLVSAGRAAVSGLQTERWTDAVDRLDEILEIAFAFYRAEREVHQTVDALRETAVSLREDAEKPERREYVTAERMRDLAVLTEDVAAVAGWTDGEPRDGEPGEAGEYPGSPAV